MGTKINLRGYTAGQKINSFQIKCYIYFNIGKIFPGFLGFKCILENWTRQNPNIIFSTYFAYAPKYNNNKVRNTCTYTYKIITY